MVQDVFVEKCTTHVLPLENFNIRNNIGLYYNTK